MNAIVAYPERLPALAYLDAILYVCDYVSQFIARIILLQITPAS